MGLNILKSVTLQETHEKMSILRTGNTLWRNLQMELKIQGTDKVPNVPRTQVWHSASLKGDTNLCSPHTLSLLSTSYMLDTELGVRVSLTMQTEYLPSRSLV